MLGTIRIIVITGRGQHTSTITASMLITGLTGGIATGKSTVSRLLQEEYHVPVVDADVLARRVVEPGTRAYRKIVKTFGEEVLLSDGSGQIDRKKLGGIVFGDEGKRKTLNRIVHPEVRWGMVKEVLKYWWRGEPWVVLDVPLLIESGIWKWVGEVVVVYCPPEEQLTRLMRRDKITEEEGRARIAAQMGIEKKIGYASVVMDNSREVDELQAQLCAHVRTVWRRRQRWWPLALVAGVWHVTRVWWR
ncbi:hypothetical protein AX15_000842 [Amanita polypyramis BW_CC]|nr:hypothetical protein AX15_000842 [Amanita polypyramis BW_CC]